MIVCMNERLHTERDRDRQMTDRQTETDRQTDRQTARERHIKKERSGKGE